MHPSRSLTIPANSGRIDIWLTIKVPANIYHADWIAGVFNALVSCEYRTHAGKHTLVSNVFRLEWRTEIL